MKFFKSIIGFILAGVLFNKLWIIFTEKFGISGGWIAALVLVAPLWFLNHYIGLIENDKEHAFLDMAFGVAVANLTYELLTKGVSNFSKSIPTFLCVIIGSILGGLFSALVEKYNKARKDT